MFNASVIGKVGVIVAADEKVYRSFVKIRGYFDFLRQAGKSQYSPRNLLVIRNEDFLEIISNWE